jgi:large subunit ribosomal protein L28
VLFERDTNGAGIRVRPAIVAVGAERGKGSENAMQCEITGKKRSFGHNVSHAKNRTNRYWLPNVQKKRVMIDGKMVRIQISTRALRTLTKTGRMAAKGK